MPRLLAIWAASDSAAYPPPACSSASARAQRFIAALVDRRVLVRHLDLGVAQAAYDVVETARGQDPLAGQDLGVADARVLREVADLAGGQHRAGGRLGLAGEDLGEGGLAGAVAPDEADLVAGGDAEADVLHEEASARADLELLGGDHRRPSLSATLRIAATPSAAASLPPTCSTGKALRMRFNPKAARHAPGRRRRARRRRRHGRRRHAACRSPAAPRPAAASAACSSSSCSSCSPSAWAAAAAPAPASPAPAWATTRGLEQDSERYANCKTGADANEDVDCARKAVVYSPRAVLGRDAARAGRHRVPPAQVITFSGGVNTGCGQATSQVGPFYCPADQQIYLDTTFFADVLEGQLGGPGGDFVEPYVLAHEYGHHIQNLLGTMGQVRTQQGPESDAVRLELQADCYAGMWTARRQRRRRHRRGADLELTEQDIDEAHRLRQGRRRRPDPAADRPAGRPRGVDPRLVGAAHALVHDRLRGGHPRGLRHLRGQRALRPSTEAGSPLEQGLDLGRHCRCIATRYGATAGWRNLPGQRALPAGRPAPAPSRPG